MGSESVRVKIFGEEYSFKGDAETDADVIRQAALHVDSKMAEFRELTASRDSMRIAVLSAVNIAGELFETKAKLQAEIKKVQECQVKIKSINSMIEGVKKTV